MQISNYCSDIYLTSLGVTYSSSTHRRPGNIGGTRTSYSSNIYSYTIREISSASYVLDWRTWLPVLSNLSMYGNKINFRWDMIGNTSLLSDLLSKNAIKEGSITICYYKEREEADTGATETSTSYSSGLSATSSEIATPSHSEWKTWKNTSITASPNTGSFSFRFGAQLDNNDSNDLIIHKVYRTDGYNDSLYITGIDSGSVSNSLLSSFSVNQNSIRTISLNNGTLKGSNDVTIKDQLGNNISPSGRLLSFQIDSNNSSSYHDSQTLIYPFGV